MTEDFVEVNVVPSGSDNAFGINLNVKDASLDPNVFLIHILFQLEEGDIPGLNDDAINDPDQLIELAKGLLLCGTEDIPEMEDIPADSCPEGHKGYFYNLEIEMELEADDGETEVREQSWQISLVKPATKTEVAPEQLFTMIQDFFTSHL